VEHKFTSNVNALTVRVQCVWLNYFGCSVCLVELFWVFSVFGWIILGVQCVWLNYYGCSVFLVGFVGCSVGLVELFLVFSVFG
jgi:hypothetical protein